MTPWLQWLQGDQLDAPIEIQYNEVFYLTHIFSGTSFRKISVVNKTCNEFDLYNRRRISLVAIGLETPLSPFTFKETGYELSWYSQLCAKIVRIPSHIL